jgi:NodT family efflux transporter outer membrane factor (OMF) lipoprotein
MKKSFTVHSEKLPNKGLMSAVSASVLLALLSCAGGCASLTVDYESDIVLPENYTGFISGEKNEKALNEWWRLFNDDCLSRLIAAAIEANGDLRTARLRYETALHEEGLSRADLGPKLSLGGGILGGRGSVNTSGGRIDSTDSQSALFTGLQGSWEPDFFGEKQSRADAAGYRALAASDSINAVQTSVTALLARKYFEVLYLQERRGILLGNIANLKELRRYAEGRFRAGQATAYDITDIGNRIIEAESELGIIDSEAEASVRAIAVLTGVPPQNFSIDNLPSGLPDGIPEPPAGFVPGDLLLRRPDILSKRNEINARAATVASAKADLYPRFNISFLGQTGRIELHAGPDARGWGSFLSGTVSVPVFTNGRIRENIEARNAEMKVTLAEYDTMILKALKEVDDGYAGITAETDRIAALEKGLSEAVKLRKEADKLFRYGRADFDAMVNAETRKLSFEAKLSESRYRRIGALIDLYRALGGGWNYEPDASAEKSTAEDGNEP